MAVHNSERPALLARQPPKRPASCANPTWGAFSVGDATGDSYYNALEVSVTKRVSHGLQFQSEYTYSKLIDDGDGERPSQSTSTSNLADYFARSAT